MEYAFNVDLISIVKDNMFVIKILFNVSHVLLPNMVFVKIIKGVL